MQSDTIAAISTGMTNAGIGKVRLSGEDAVAIVDRIKRCFDTYHSLWLYI